uniref:Chemokine interleukin-8-like domain-containing protein n=1 Tax=Leptobrachium leishanense TaxID=445787 RepID=A0A8C5PIL5_9ANUR
QSRGAWPAARGNRRVCAELHLQLLVIPDDRYIAVPGMSIFGKQRCRCNGRLVNGLDPKSITRFGVFPPGSICDKVDIIVTMKSGKQICVNPNSKMVKNILSGLTKNGDKPQG